MLLRPKIILLTEYSSRNDKAQDELDYGICNVDKTREITIFLSNITEVTANWTLNYVKFPKKQTISKYTTTAWEEENLEKLDDPDVFDFEYQFVSETSPVDSKFKLDFLFGMALNTKCAISLFVSRDPSGVSPSRCARSQKALSCPPSPRTSSRNNSNAHKSKSSLR